MEIGRETPSAAQCARILEAAWSVVGQGVGRLGRAVACRFGAWVPKPVRPMDD